MEPVIGRPAAVIPGNEETGMPGAGLAILAARTAVVIALLCLMLPAATVAEDGTGDTEPQSISQQVGPDFILADAGDLKMVIGFDLAHQDRDQRGFIPLVASILSMKHELVRIRKDEFHLYGEGGIELPMATLKEVRSQYRYYRQDINIATTSNYLEKLPYPGDPQPTSFFPAPGSVGIYAVTIDFKQTFVDLLYFKGDWRQRLRLVVEGNKTRPELEVSFQMSVPVQ